MFKRLVLGAATAAALATQAAQAAPFGVFDPRSLAMGGIGVSSATSQNASFFNPALLSAAQKNDDFSLEIPILAARIADADKLRDDIDNLDAAGQTLTDAITNFNAQIDGSPAQQAAATGVANSLTGFGSVLNTISNKTLDAGLFAGVLVAIPSQSLGFGAHMTARADFGVSFNYSSGDAVTLSNYVAAANAAAGGDYTLLNNFCEGNNCATGALLDPNLTSTVKLQGVLIEETGVTLAHKFDSLGGIAIGITPKSMRINTVDYSVSPQSADIDLDLGRREYTDTNFDIGAAMDYGDGYKTGIVVKNVMSKSYDTVLGNKIELKPQVRLGMSHHTDWSIVGVDLDVTKNDPVGFLGKESQFLAVGTELNLLSILQLRLGYRHDLAGNYDGLYSVGVGFSPLGIHLDLGLAGNDNEVAAGFQFGLSF
jgi:hypothetical protein